MKQRKRLFLIDRKRIKEKHKNTIDSVQIIAIVFIVIAVIALFVMLVCVLADNYEYIEYPIAVAVLCYIVVYLCYRVSSKLEESYYIRYGETRDRLYPEEHNTGCDCRD